MKDRERRETFGLYIHWPFCLSKCPYCDFNSHVRDRIETDRWGQALLKELSWARTHFGDGRHLESLFFGGGTPSLMPASLVRDVISTARELWPSDSDLEVTLEANPTSSEASKFEDFARAGVNRLSLGVQAFVERDLKFLGRTHSGPQALEAIYWASQTFPRFSFDLIYALPGQTVEGWRTTLEKALSLKPRHLSCYQLTYEPGTAFYQKFLRGELAYPEEDLAVALYEETEAALGQAGLAAYEVSNYAVPGQECRHNLIYWRYQDYIGIGPGAHGRVFYRGEKNWQKRALKNLRAPETWLAAVEERGNGLEEEVSLGGEEVFQEWLLMGLRLKEGLKLATCETVTGRPWQHWVSERTTAHLVQQGLIEEFPGVLALSSRGRLVLDRIGQVLTKNFRREEQ